MLNKKAAIFHVRFPAKIFGHIAARNFIRRDFKIYSRAIAAEI